MPVYTRHSWDGSEPASESIDRQVGRRWDAGLEPMIYPPPSSSSPGPLQDGPQEPDELTRFRNDWKQEVGSQSRVTLKCSFPSEDKLPASQHYSAEELPQAQDSFVCLTKPELLFLLPC